MYGKRLRIGYTSVAYVTEVFTQAFYRMAPQNVSLALLTIHQNAVTKAEMDRLYDQSMESARALAKTGVDILVLGGRPVLLSRGAGNLPNLIAALEKELGVRVTTDATAQLAAFHALGSKLIGTSQPFGASHNDRFNAMITEMGLTPTGCNAIESNLIDLPTVPTEACRDLARALKVERPETDTILFPCPHWAVVDAIDPLEKELDVNIVTNLQATLWHSLRACSISDRINGFGRLLRDY